MSGLLLRGPRSDLSHGVGNPFANEAIIWSASSAIIPAARLMSSCESRLNSSQSSCAIPLAGSAAMSPLLPIGCDPLDHLGAEPLAIFVAQCPLSDRTGGVARLGGVIPFDLQRVAQPQRVVAAGIPP
jgi:hypothetical protein